MATQQSRGRTSPWVCLTQVRTPRHSPRSPPGPPSLRHLRPRDLPAAAAAADACPRPAGRQHCCRAGERPAPRASPGFSGESGGDSGLAWLAEELSQGAPSLQGRLALSQGPPAPGTACGGQPVWGRPPTLPGPAGLTLRLPPAFLGALGGEQTPAESGEAKGPSWLSQ